MTQPKIFEGVRKTEINITVTGKELADLIKGLNEPKKVDVGELASAMNERIKRRIEERQFLYNHS